LLMCTTPTIVSNRSNNVALVPKSKSFLVATSCHLFRKNLFFKGKEGRRGCDA
jgi:hypothetical protein